MPVKPVLVFAYGNVSRGDDGLAPLLLESIRNQGLLNACGSPLKFLEDYQLQIEHITDLQGCQRILLLDADSSLDKPYCFYPVTEQLETTYTTHSLSPSTLLHTFKRVYGCKAPITAMLAIQGVSFNLGEELSAQAEQNLQLANEFTNSILIQNDFQLWDEMLDQ